MSQPPTPFDRSWSFTDFSQSNPTTPHQGQKIDQELNNARTAINATISRLGEVQADDGKIRTTALNLAVIAEEVEPLLTDAPVQAIENAGAAQIALVNDAGDTKVAELEAVLTSQNAIDAIAARDDAETAAASAAIASSDANSYAGLAEGYATTALQAKNSALVHANTAEAAVATIAAANYASYHHTHAISNVTGLQSALDGKYSVNNPAGYITSSALTGYLTDAPSDGSSYGRKDGSWEVIGSGSYLPLAGGTMTGAITFDGTSGQYISKGNFDTSRGGNYGISLVCSIGYEFNWQAGWLTTTNQGSSTPRPLYLDSLAGTTLRSWDSANDRGVEVAHTGINVANIAPEYVNITPPLIKVFENINELGVSIAHDSIAIQHIDTPDQTAYFTNEYIGFEDMSGTPHSAWIEHDVITVQDETRNTQMRASGVIATGPEGQVSYSNTAVDIAGPVDPLHDPAVAHLKVNGLEFRLMDDVPASVYGSINWQNEDGTGNYNYSAPGEALACYFADGSGTRIQGGYIRAFTAGEASEIVIDPSVGITFPDGSIQSTATLTGPQGPQGEQGPPGNTGSNGNDGGSFPDAMYDGTPYVRINQSWQPLSYYDQQGGGGIGDAPANGTAYVRYNNDWQPFSNFDQTGGGGGWSYDFSAIVSSLTNGATSSINGYQPTSGQVLKFDGSQIIWASDNEGGGGGQGPQGEQGPQGPQGNDGPMGGNFSDAPNDGTSYVRMNGSWYQTFRDFTPYNASGDPFYPYEVKITVNGTDYWMPVRQA